MPSLTTVTLDKEYAFQNKETLHTKSSSSSPPSFLDITRALQQYLKFIVSFTFSSQHQIAVFISHNNCSIPSSLPLFLFSPVYRTSCYQAFFNVSSLISEWFQRSTRTLLMLTTTIILDCVVIVNPIHCGRTRSCFSLESFTCRSFYCNEHSMLNPNPLSWLKILPSFPHTEDADYQQQARHAIAITPHSISDSSEMNTTEWRKHPFGHLPLYPLQV